MNTHLNINILPLGPYDVLVGMDWLEPHRVILNFQQNFFTCINDEGEACKIKKSSKSYLYKANYCLAIKEMFF